MIQRPLSENSGLSLAWRNTSSGRSGEGLIFPGYAQMKTVFHKIQKSKVSAIFSTADKGRSVASYSKKKLDKGDLVHEADLRLARNTLPNSTHNIRSSMSSAFFPEINNESRSDSITVGNYYQIPMPSKFSPVIDVNDVQNLETKGIQDNTISSLDSEDSSKDNIIETKKLFTITNHSNADIAEHSQQHKVLLDGVDESNKSDYVPEGVQEEARFIDSYNTVTNPFTCTAVRQMHAEIDTQEKFNEFDIEPPWMPWKHFWSSVYEGRYESLMKNPKWPPLEVILIPRTHVDTIWKKSFDQCHKDVVSKILSNIVKKLNFCRNFTFTWNEVSHLSQWWKNASLKSRSIFRKLLKSGRLEITTGGWVEPDEATTTLFELVHQLVEGHQWLKSHLGYTPKTAWSTNTVSHSPTMTYLLSGTGITQLVITNLHYSWEQFIAEYQYSDFIWLQNWDTDKKSSSVLNDVLKKIGKDRYPKHSVLTHFLQFNSAGFSACGPNETICTSHFDFANVNQNLNINFDNVQEKSELLLEQYSKTGTISSHNIVIAPLGGPYSYESQTDFDFQYNNYDKISEFVNTNRDTYKATIRFGTPKDYFRSILAKQNMYPTVKEDFVNFADLSSGAPAYWTGFYTSRPLAKILLRRLQSTLRSTEILLTFAAPVISSKGYNMSKYFELLIKARENIARLSDRNVASGTLTAKALRYSHSLTLATVKDCWHLQEIATSLLNLKTEQTVPYFQKYVYRNGEFISNFRTVSPGDQIYVFNSLSHGKTEVIELITRYPNIRVVNYDNNDISIQINPYWKYTSDNLIKISRKFYKVVFVIVVPPISFQLFRLKETYDTSQNAATIYCLFCIIEDVEGTGIFPFVIQPLQTGDIQLENYKLRLFFDEHSGFLKTVLEKESNIQKSVVMDYSTFKDSGANSGMFLFNPSTSKPLYDILKPFKTGSQSKIIMIISGSVSTELSSVYGRLLQTTVRILNLVHSPLAHAIFIETKVDYEVSPKNRELELFLSLQTDIDNSNPPKMYTDNNGFGFSARVLNITRRVESNVYPITSMAYIQDHRSRLTIITDHAQGVTALQEGHVAVFLDRRVLHDDGRGTGEGLADSTTTYHRHIVLLENFIDDSVFREFASETELQLPSLTATHLANSLNYVLDIFIIDKNQSRSCHYPFLPLIKIPFPCDVSLLNYRIILDNTALSHYMPPNSALMILQRHGVSCQIDHSTRNRCSGDASFSLDKILRNVKEVYRTNIVGTSQGISGMVFNKVNFPPMELLTLQIHF